MPAWITDLIPAFAIGSIAGLAIIAALGYWTRYRRYGVLRLQKMKGAPFAARTQAPKLSTYVIIRTVVLTGIAAISLFYGEYITAGICLLLTALPFLFHRLNH